MAFNFKISLLLIFLFCVFNQTVLTQGSSATISGQISDYDTGEPLFFVNIYLANTTIGTTSDENGYFLIKNPPTGGYDLVFSHVAYEIKSRQVQIDLASSLVINEQLRMKIFSSSEISIISEEPKLWRRRLKDFQIKFLGETENSKKCVMVNPEVLEFKMDSVNNDLIAFSDSELVVENWALGYRIISQLQSFKWSTSIIEHQVFTRFEELKAEDEYVLEQWKKNRQKTYEGSFKHFLASFSRRRLEEEGFDIYHGDLKMFQEGFGSHLDPVVLYPFKKNEGDSRFKRLYFRKWLKVVYLLKLPFDESFLNLASGPVFVDSLGNFLTAPIIEKAGYWSEQRMADQLPLDYFPDYK